MKKAFYFILIILSLSTISCEKQKAEVVESAKAVSEIIEVEAEPAKLLTTSIPGEVQDEEDEIVALDKPLTLIDKFSYVYGVTDFEKIINTPDFNLFYYLKGLVDAYYDDLYFTREEMSEIYSQYYELLLMQSEEELTKLKETNLKAAENFLKSNELRDGVEETITGLQFEVLKEGYEEGRSPKDGDTVLVNYQLITLSGQIKESTYLTSEPVEIKLSSVVRGFQQALKVMKEGEKIRAWVHPNIGFGTSGSGNIMPNELLIYDIELLMVKDNI